MGNLGDGLSQAECTTDPNADINETWGERKTRQLKRSIVGNEMAAESQKKALAAITAYPGVLELLGFLSGY